MQRRSSLSNDLWQTLSDQVSEDFAFLESPVSPTDLLRSDFKGWLVDSKDGTRYWCIVADILFCMFDSPTSQNARKTLVLPGYDVKPFVFLSENTHQSPSHATATGVSKYQFKMIHQNSKGTEFVFDVENERELQKWVKVLRLASSLDYNIISNTDDEESSDENADFYGNYGRYNNNDLDLPAVKYQLPTSPTAMNSSHRNRSKSENAKRAFFDLTDDLERKESNATSSAERRLVFARTSPPIGESGVSRDDFSYSSSSAKSSPCGSLERCASLGLRHSSSASAVVDAPRRSLTEIRHDRASTEPTRFTLGMKLAKRASKVKEKMSSFRSVKVKTNHTDAVTVGSLSNVKHSGELLQKMKSTWIKCWCAVSSGNLYIFPSNQETEVADICMPLVGCKASQSQKEKVPNLLKVSHRDIKTIYLQTNNFAELIQWIDLLNKEAYELHKSASDPNLFEKDTGIHKSNSLAVMQGKVGRIYEKNENAGSQRKHISAEKSPATEKRMATLRMSRASFAEGYENFNGENDPESQPAENINTQTEGHSIDDDDVFGTTTTTTTRTTKTPLAESTVSFHRTVHSEDESSQSEMECSPRASSRGLRKMSIHGSLGDLPGAITNEKVKKVKNSKKKGRPGSMVKIAANEWTNPIKTGYVNRKSKGPWTKCWMVLNEDTLYVYRTPEDMVTMDTTHLPGYKVSTDVKTAFKSRKLTFKLSHEGSRSTYIATETEAELHAWVDVINKATQKITMEGLNLELGVSKEFETKKDDKETLRKENEEEFRLELTKIQKDQLIQEMIAHSKGPRKKGFRPKSMPPISNTKDEINLKYEKSLEEEELKALKYQTILKQRRMSAQIKKDDLQKKLFEDKKKKTVSEVEYEAMDKTLQELNDTLTSVECEIRMNENMKTETMECLKQKKELELKICAQQHKMKEYRKVAAEKALQEISETVGQVSQKASEQITMQVSHRQFPDRLSAVNLKRRTLPVIPQERSPMPSPRPSPQPSPRPSPILSHRTVDGSENNIDNESLDKFSLHSTISDSSVKTVSSSGGDSGLNFTPGLTKGRSESPIQTLGQRSLNVNSSEEKTMQSVATTVVVSNLEDESGKAEINKQSQTSSEQTGQKTKHIRTEVSAETLAEIEAFEKLALEMLAQHPF
ncbi:uncharacterized protein LOC144451164 [Glandiceps talaboti]